MWSQAACFTVLKCGLVEGLGSGSSECSGFSGCFQVHTTRWFSVKRRVSPVGSKPRFFHFGIEIVEPPISAFHLTSITLSQQTEKVEFQSQTGYVQPTPFLKTQFLQHIIDSTPSKEPLVSLYFCPVRDTAQRVFKTAYSCFTIQQNISGCSPGGHCNLLLFTNRILTK